VLSALCYFGIIDRLTGIGHGVDFQDPSTLLPRIFYGNPALLERAAKGMDLVQAFTPKQIDLARSLIVPEKLRLAPIKTPEERVREGISKAFIEGGLKIAEYNGALIRQVVAGAEARKDNRNFDLFFQYVPYDDLVNDPLRMPSQGIDVAKKPGMCFPAQWATSLDLIADSAIHNKTLPKSPLNRTGLTFAQLMSDFGNLFVLSEEMSKIDQHALENSKYTVVCDGVDNTGGLVGYILSILGVQKLRGEDGHDQKIDEHYSNKQVTSNYALLEDGRPIEGILCCPLRAEPKILCTTTLENGERGVRKFNLDINTGKIISEDPVVTKRSELRTPSNKTLRCQIGHDKNLLGEAHELISRSADNGYKHHIIHGSGQEKIMSLFTGDAELVFNNNMMSWDLAATIAIAQAAGYDVAILPESGKVLDSAYMHQYRHQELDLKTSEVIKYRTVIGHPQLLRDLGLEPQLDVVQRNLGMHK
jgi:hypothetical protein